MTHLPCAKPNGMIVNHTVLDSRSKTTVDQENGCINVGWLPKFDCAAQASHHRYGNVNKCTNAGKYVVHTCKRVILDMWHWSYMHRAFCSIQCTI